MAENSCHYSYKWKSSLPSEEIEVVSNNYGALQWEQYTPRLRCWIVTIAW